MQCPKQTNNKVNKVAMKWWKSLMSVHKGKWKWASRKGVINVGKWGPEILTFLYVRSRKQKLKLSASIYIFFSFVHVSNRINVRGYF